MATDNCDNNPVITFAEVEEPGTCEGNYTLIRTWTATDNCGNTSQMTQIVTVGDNTSPMISCPAEITVSCNESIDPSNTGMATATDACSAVTIDYSDGDLIGECPTYFERTWTATDLCGNVSSCTQQIFVNDETNPLITCPCLLYTSPSPRDS